jgi:hypothetical protein
MLLAAALVASACNGDDDDTTEAGDTTASTGVDQTTSTVVDEPASTTEPASDLQLALWPAPDVIFQSPDHAATDFIEGAFPGAAVTLSEFRQGDNQSGEIEVFRPTEGGGQGSPASTLVLRRLGEQNGWFVIAASNPAITIDSVEAGASVHAGPLRVTGLGRGFEATLNVIARPAGAFGAGDIALAVANGGAGQESLPYEVTIDLPGAAAGTVMLLVRGDTGLDGDTGEFTAIPIVVL